MLIKNLKPYHNRQAVGLSQMVSLIVDLLHQMKYFQSEQPMPNTLKCKWFPVKQDITR